jgi:Spy/CpxP family protein refolding chaperone
MKALHSLIGAIAVLVAAASLAGAQEDPQPEPTAPRTRMRIHEPGTGLEEGVTPRQLRAGGRGRFEEAGFGPAVLLRQRDFLNLSDEQVAQLEQLESAVREDQDEAREVFRARQDELRAAWRADEPDADLIRQKTADLLQARQQVELTRVETAAKAKALLSGEQLGKVRGFQEGMRRGGGMSGDRAGHGMHRGRRSAPPRSRANRRT